MPKIYVAPLFVALGVLTLACGSSSNSTPNSGTNSNGPVEIKVDPNNMPPGLSTTPLPVNGTPPPGISLKPIQPEPGKRIPGIPTNEEIKKGVKLGNTPIPGIDPDAARKAMGYPSVNANVQPYRGEPMMKSNRKTGGKPQ